MKLTLAAFVAAVSCACAAFTPLNNNGDIAADSPVGRSLLAKARRHLEEGDNGNYQQYAWVAGFSLKFQGCHHVKQFNDDADEDADVRIETKRLVRFRLCPTSTCNNDKAVGCSGGFGDYIIDMETYVQAYFEANQEEEEEEEEQEQDEGGFDVQDYMQCAQFAGEEEEQDEDEDGEDRRRQLDEDQALYIGPYCAEQGGVIFLGVFTDDTCTEFADDEGGRTTFKSLMGADLPYSEETIVDMDCQPCVEQANGDDDGDNNDEDYVSEQCEQIYQSSGKCERKLQSGVVDEPNNNACNYMDGIKIVREDGIIFSKRKPSGWVTFFIVLFALTFAALGFYVWYLRMRLGVKSNRLL